MTFAEVAGRLEAAIGQASLLINDRLRTLQNRCRGADVTAAQARELCDIADGIAAASYHVQKWAHALQIELPPQATQARPPFKPMACEDREEAFATVRSALPRLMVGGSEATKALAAALKAHGERAKARVAALGVPMDDLWALAPHLERLVLRLGRLTSDVGLARPMRKPVHEFAQECAQSAEMLTVKLA